MATHPTVFLIDDDADDQEIFSIALEAADKNVNCIFANDGMQALEKIKKDSELKPDFIFIDMNMPRMNGHQCLTELKKIERLKDVPVYMYSTSADPGSIEQHKKLGATDFIVKPSDINTLTDMLAGILKRQVLPLMFFLCCLTMIPRSIHAQDTIAPVKNLKKLSVEELMNVEVTSVSKLPQRLKEVASSIQVVSNEEIVRSGVPRLTGALRLATNLHVAQSGAHDWGISARGFNGIPAGNTSLANKLLVLIDGRSVYTPLFGGVFWDVQNVMLEDLDKIEVISGPGGALWGGNAVNGIINIKSKSAKETQGIYGSVAAGSLVQDLVSFRYGSHIDTTLYFRVYGQRFDYNHTKRHVDTIPNDNWFMNQAGFRMDYFPSHNNTITLQGDVYGGEEDDSAKTYIDGQNILGRWSHTFSEKSGLTVQLYFDRTYRNFADTSLKEELKTYDIDVQHNTRFGKRHLFVWGAGFRTADDKLTLSADQYIPARRQIELWNIFVQDQISLVPDKLELTIGTKVLDNDYTKLEWHPTVRLAYHPRESHTLWSAVSRGVRVPTRFDADNNGIVLGSNKDYKSESVIAYELGYRFRPLDNLSFSIASFYNVYDDLRSIDTNRTPLPFFEFRNNLEAESWGVELSANYAPFTWWRLRGGYTYLDKKFTYNSPLTYFESEVFEAVDPHNQFLVQSMMDVFRHFQVDGVVRYVDALPEAIDIPFVSSYITFDVRLAWNYKWATLSITGQNLANSYHKESGERKIPRSVYGKLSVSF